MNPLFISLLFILQIVPSSSLTPRWYQNCNTFTCGSLAGIHYPFRGNTYPDYCGYPGLELNCNPNNITTIHIANTTYRVLSIDETSQIMKIAREDLMESTCPRDLLNTTLDYRLFDYATSNMNITFLYGCPDLVNLPGFNFNTLSCGSKANRALVVIGAQGPGMCNVSVVVPVPVLQTGLGELPNSEGLGRILKQGVEVRWTVDLKGCNECTGSGGRCGYDLGAKRTTCFCPNPPYQSSTCSATVGAPPGSTFLPAANNGSTDEPTSGSTSDRKIVLPVVGAILAGIVVGWLIFFCRQRRKRLAARAQTVSKGIPTPTSSKGVVSTTPSARFTRSNPSFPSSRSEPEKASTYFGVQVFTYAELEEATNNFDTSRELGDGGFGTVYYGKLIDGREVAVKRLYENNFKRVEQFINEVEILTRLHHQYLVKLYGCTSKRSRDLLLVYEYIPNGTVADHLHGKRAKPGLLSWPVRLNIAIETAEALTFLHQSDIIHRDVKTNNILLDNSFCVKVADFGLSRLFPNDATHVSTAPQGTPGYVDPEYYQCYQLTDKSDVYSFGVVLVELISSLQAVDTNRHRHDINLANMAINKIQNQRLNELVDPSLEFESNGSVRRMTTLVAELAFRCLQQEKDMRPSMKEVLDTLRGIEKEELNAQKGMVVDIAVNDGVPLKDDGVLLKDGNASLPSPDSVVLAKWVSSSTLDSNV